MSNITQAVITRADDEAVITVSVPGDSKSPYIARSDHPNFKAMVGAVATGDLAELPALFDVAETIALKFQRLSERVTVDNGQVLFDGTAVDSTLTQHILDVLSEGASDASWSALVNFFEKVQTNPNEESRDQLYNWIKAQDGLTITEAGDMVGYKYVAPDSEFGFRSSSSGKEPVRVTWTPDGGEERSEVFVGRIPNPIGGLIEMPRHYVDANPNRTCSVGLHIGAWNYVKGSDSILEVHVNPRDVVAVPTDYHGEKVRACRYTVVGRITSKYGQSVKLADEAPKPDVRGKEIVPATREELDVTLAPAREALKATFKTGDLVEVTAIPEWLPGVRPELNVKIGDQFKIGHVSKQECLELRLLDGEFGYWTEGASIKHSEARKPSIGGLTHGTYVVDFDGDKGTIELDGAQFYVAYENPAYGRMTLDSDAEVSNLQLRPVVDAARTPRRSCVKQGAHGRGGATSQAAKGRGKNPAQDDAGKFSSGRPGSQRDPKTGRFGG